MSNKILFALVMGYIAANVAVSGFDSSLNDKPPAGPYPGYIPPDKIVLRCDASQWDILRQVYQDTYSHRVILPDGTNVLVQRGECTAL